MSTYPEAFSRFYDVIYAQVRDSVDKRYYVDKLTSCRGPSLEVGVGTGRIFLEALRQGADVYGLDASPAMIAVLRSKLEARHHNRIRECDLVTMSLGERFDLITQITSVTMTLSWDDEAGPSTAEWSFPMRFFFRYELEHLIARSKLRLRAMYGDFSESPLGPTSKEFLVHCIRE